MTTDLITNLETGGITAFLITIGIFIVRYFLRDQNGRRETFKAFAEQAKSDLETANNKIDQLRVEHIAVIKEMNTDHVNTVKEIHLSYEHGMKEIRDGHDATIQRLMENHELKLEQVRKECDERIKSIVRSHDDKIEEKDRQLTESRSNYQNLVIADVEIKSRLADAVEGMKQTMIQIVNK
jgi:hypothetical protein